MANERLALARDLIKAKRYGEARRTLTGLDHPTARVWLAKLDEIAPEVVEDDPFDYAVPLKPTITPLPKVKPQKRLARTPAPPVPAGFVQYTWRDKARAVIFFAIMFLFLAILVYFLIFPGGTRCSDGSYSGSTGSGTCSSHGGVAGGRRK